MTKYFILILTIIILICEDDTLYFVFFEYRTLYIL